MRFELAPAGYKYRALKLADKGYDIFALQGGLSLTADGDFGPLTNGAVRGFQEQHGLTVDGIAGIVTQRTLALQLIWPVQAAKQTPSGLMRGQVEKESGFILGNHSPRYEDGEFDCGVAQRNSNYTPMDDGFHPRKSLEALGARLRSKHDEYQGYGKVTDERRLWELAAGAWNAPSWTDKLAKGGTLTQSQSDWLTAYIGRVTVYMVVS